MSNELRAAISACVSLFTIFCGSMLLAIKCTGGWWLVAAVMIVSYGSATMAVIPFTYIINKFKRGESDE